jgi:hypothetical protein
MNRKKSNYFDKNIVTHKQSFIAYFFYIKKEKALNVVLRNGKQYRYADVPVKTFDEVMNATNRSNFIACNIIHSKKFKSEMVGIVPAADVQRVTQPVSFTRFLAQ